MLETLERVTLSPVHCVPASRLDSVPAITVRRMLRILELTRESTFFNIHFLSRIKHG